MELAEAVAGRFPFAPLSCNELFHVASGFADVAFQQLTGSVGVALAAEFQNGAVFVFGLVMRVAQKQNVQPDIAIGVVVDGLNQRQRAAAIGGGIECGMKPPV